MNACLRVMLPAVLVVAAGPARAASVELFGTAKIKPTFYGNFDFDSGKADLPTLNEGGWAAGQHTRAELRLGWRAAGDRWKIMMIAETDLIVEKDTADRSFYNASLKNGQPNVVPSSASSGRCSATTSCRSSSSRRAGTSGSSTSSPGA